MTTDTTGAPRVTAVRTKAPLLDQQIHVLVDEQTRAYTIGLAALAAKSTGRAGRLAEGVEVRDLLDEAIAARYVADRAAYAEAVIAGRAELQRRATAAA